VYNNKKNPRLYVILVIFLASFILLFSRLIYIQIVSSNKLSKIANNQYNKIVEVPADRGNIYDRHHRPLALTTPVYSIYADPSKVKDIDFVSGKLSQMLEIPQDTLNYKINQPNKYFVWIKRHISKEEKTKIENSNLFGVGLIKEKARFYPNEKLASHILGYSGIDTQGLSGIEYSFDKQLKGISRYRYINIDAISRELVYLSQEYVKPNRGHSLVLTIDEVVQHIIELALEEAVKKWRAVGGTILVMDPFSGEILGMANYPTFDPNNFLNYNPESTRNRAISDIIEPGSTFKIVAASAIVEESLIDEEEKIYCENGAYKISSHILNDYHPHEYLTFPEVIIHSSNIGVVKLSQKLGERKLYDYIRLFGFGERTGIKLPGEAKGIIRDPKNWSRISIASIPIGQEVGITAIQMACAISVIANGGKLVKPVIVKEIEFDENITLKKFYTSIKRRVISQETASYMKQILSRVVTEGTGDKASVKGIDVAGKTGTAQKIGKDGKYSASKYIASFVGFAPVNKPLLSVVVMIDEPKPIHFGGTVAAPVFREVISAILSYLKTSEHKILTSNPAL